MILDNKIADKFELILLANQRVKDLNNGFLSTVPEDKHKKTVVALKEIEEDNLDILELKERHITHHRLKKSDEEYTEELMESNFDIKIAELAFDNFDDFDYTKEEDIEEYIGEAIDE